MNRNVFAHLCFAALNAFFATYSLMAYGKGFANSLLAAVCVVIAVISWRDKQ